MFPTYREYYINFLEKIKDLPEPLQEGLISILKLRCESGIIPSKSYGDDSIYYNFAYNVPENLIGFLDKFDEHFFTGQLVEKKYAQMASQILQQLCDGFKEVKAKGVDYYKGNPLRFMLDMKKIFDSEHINSNNMINEMILNKRNKFDQLLIQYYENMITQEELNSLIVDKKITNIDGLGSQYHKFLSDRFMTVGILMCKEIDETRTKLNESGLNPDSEVYQQCKLKLDIAEKKGKKFSNTYKALGIINWLTYANEYKFIDRFKRAIHIVQQKIEQYAEDNMTAFEEEKIIETETGEIYEKTNSVEQILENLEKNAEYISQNIIENIEKELSNMQGLNNIEKNNFIELKINEYIQKLIENTQLCDQEIIGAIRDNVKLKLAMYKLGSSMDDGLELLQNALAMLNQGK